MKEQDYFVLAIALLATVLAISSGWLRYDNADDTEETSELWYDTGLILGVLYVVAVIVIYFAQTSHEMYQKFAHEGTRSAIRYGANRVIRATEMGSAEDAVHSAGTLGQTVQGGLKPTIGDHLYGYPHDPELTRSLNEGLEGR